MRMHTAVRLNVAIRKKSGDAELVIINFPAPPAKLAAEENCILYCYRYSLFDSDTSVDSHIGVYAPLKII